MKSSYTSAKINKRVFIFRLFSFVDKMTNSVVVKSITPASVDGDNLSNSNFEFLGTHLPLELDVTSPESVKSVIDEAINKYKRPPSITVNCAGITRDQFILKMDDSDFDLVLNVNLKVRKSFQKLSRQ